MLATVFLAQPIFEVAQPSGDPAAQKEKHHPHWLKELELSDTQKASVDEIRQKHQADFQSKKKAMKEAHQSFATAISNSASTDDALKQAFDNLQKAKQAMHEHHFTQMLEIRKILTPEQLEKMKTFKPMFHDKKHQKHKKDNVE